MTRRATLSRKPQLELILPMAEFAYNSFFNRTPRSAAKMGLELSIVEDTICFFCGPNTSGVFLEFENGY